MDQHKLHPATDYLFCLKHAPTVAPTACAVPVVLQMLLADDDSSEVALTHAVVWRLIHGLGCASVSRALAERLLNIKAMLLLSLQRLPAGYAVLDGCLP